MKKDSSAPVQAHEFEAAVAADVTMGDRRCVNTRLYALADAPGVWRRVPRTGRGLKAGDPGNRVAYFDGSLIELARDVGLEAELREAGIVALGNGMPGDTLDDAALADILKIRLQGRRRAGVDVNRLQRAIDVLEGLDGLFTGPAAAEPESQTPAEPPPDNAYALPMRPARSDAAPAEEDGEPLEDVLAREGRR